MRKKIVIAKKVWQYLPPKKDNVERLADALDISRPTAAVVVGRGYTDPESAFHFLHPDYEDLSSPFDIKDMGKLISRLKRAAEKGERISIFGDTDVDGVTSVALMKMILQSLKIKHEWALPLRLVEGYGFNRRGLHHAVEWGADIIITLDCGIGSEDLFREARAAGIDTVVIDHHVAKSRPPSACAVINPKVLDSYPFKELTTAGLILKLAIAASERLGAVLPMDEVFGMAALSTVADVAPLVGENRVIVRLGIEALTRSSLVGIRALIKEAGLEGKRLNAGHVAFALAPRINAAGRLGKAPLAVELLVSESSEEAARIAAEVGRFNSQRRCIEEDITMEALKEVGDDPSGSVIIVSKKGWHRGIIGIVAANLVESYNRPAIVLSLGEGDAYGSARSIPAFNIYENLKQVENMLTSFGGHGYAAGLRIEPGKIDKFKTQLERLAGSAISPEDLQSSIIVDAAVKPKDLSFEFLTEQDMLRPFGLGNPRPKYLWSGAQPASRPRFMGRDKKHVGVLFQGGPHQAMRCLGWNMAPYFRSFDENSMYDLLVRPRYDDWRGEVALEIVDFRQVSKS